MVPSLLPETLIQGVFFQVGPQSKSLFVAAVHKSARGAGHGGCRLWSYSNVESFLSDALRLSRGMGRKNGTPLGLI